MPNEKCCWLWVVVITVSLFSSIFAQDMNLGLQLPSAPLAPITDGIALRALVDKFFSAYAKEDLDEFMALWAEKSSDFVSRKQTMQQIFAANDKIEVKELTVRKMVVDRDKVNVRVAVEMSAMDVKTGKPAAGFGKMSRTLHCVKKEETWKIWRYYPTAEDLAAVLVAAKTEEERAVLLSKEKELVSADLAIALINQGSRSANQRNYAQALMIDRLAQGIAEEIDYKWGVAAAFNNIGNVHYSQGNYAQALDYFQKSLTLWEAPKDNAQIAITLNNIGRVHRDQGNYSLALDYHKKGLVLRKALGDSKEIADSLNDIGSVHKAQGNYDLALKFDRKSLRMLDKLDDKAGIATTLNNIGNVHEALNNYDLALEFYQKSLTLRKVEDKAGIAQSKNNIGVAHMGKGNYELALKLFEKSLALEKELDNKAGIAETLGNIGNVQRSQGNYKSALEFHQESLRIVEALGIKAVVGNTLNNIGVVHEEQGNYAQALGFYQKCLTLREAIGDRAGIASTLNNIGEVYRAQGNYAQALECYQKSLTIAEGLGIKGLIATLLNNAGIAYEDQGDYVKALEFYEKSLAIKEASGNKADVAGTLNNTGSLYRSQGNYAKALEFYHKSLGQYEASGGKAVGMADTLTNISILHVSQGNYAQALEFAARAADLAKGIGRAEAFWVVRFIAGTAHRALNQPVQARQAFEESITTIETLRRQVAGGEQEGQRFFENKVAPYYAMVDLLVAEKKTIEALVYTERAKARVLLDVLQSGKVNITKAMTDKERAKEQELKNTLVSLNTQLPHVRDESRLTDLKACLQKARLEYEAFQTSLYAAHPELKVQRSEAKPLTLEEVYALLPDAKTALLEFVVMEERTYLFVLTKNDGEPKVYRLDIKRKDLVKRVEGFRERLSKNKEVRDARGLYDLLLKRAQKQLQGKTTLCIVPDGVLWELPFQALQPKENHYLIEDCVLFYAPSLTTLRGMMKLRDQQLKSNRLPLTLLAFGNPALSQETVHRVRSAHLDQNLIPLPEAERLVKFLEQLYGKARSKVYIGADAREGRLKAEAGKAKILQLATHGILNNVSPIYSHVVLAQEKGDVKEDGLLEAWEVMNLDLKADMAVLSACETARGRLGAGEGVIGITWALFVAGCPTTVVSQWKVDSASTMELMLRFHRVLNSQASNTKSLFSKAKALQRATLQLRWSQTNRDYRHPFHWAGFVLVGDGR